MATFSASHLFSAIESREDFLLLDVRNEDDFNQFKVEGPNNIEMLNIPYFDFIEDAEGSAALVPEGKPVLIVCAKVGSSEYVADVLTELGREDVSHLEGGIVSWGNVLVPKRINDDLDGYEVWQFNRPGKASCSYGVIYEGEMFLFDPSRNTEFYLSFAEDRGATITHTFETHLQADYISGSPKIAELTGATFVAHSSDFDYSIYDYHRLIDGEKINFSSNGGPSILCTHSPGHTPGSTTYVLGEKYMISGDTVFIVSVGRPDLGKKVVEWARMLYATLKDRISLMPDDLVVLPGHYTDWSMESDSENRILDDFGSIKQFNEDIYGISEEDEFVTYILDNMRKEPEIYGQIREVNSGRLTPCIDEQNIMDLGKNECAASGHSGIED